MTLLEKKFEPLSLNEKKQAYQKIDTALDNVLTRIKKVSLKTQIQYLSTLVNQKIKTLESQKNPVQAPSKSSLSSQTSNTSQTLENVDMAKVRGAWLSWNNDLRAEYNLDPYTYDTRLDVTALEWSQISADRGYIDHKRNPGDSYYNYPIINQWFLDRGLDFKNVYRVTHTENIWRGPYRCTQSDCTQKLIDAIRSTFDFYLSEKNRKYKPHRNSLINKYFKIIGLGIVVQDGKYYLTVHYGTEIK